MDGLDRAFDALVDQLDAIAWVPLFLGVLAHLAKMLARSRAWYGVLDSAYPKSGLRARTAVAAYVAGTGANALVPARGGDVLRLYLVKRRIPRATYTTLGATLAVEAIFDSAFALALVLWALWRGYLPGFDVLPRLPDVDWLWVFDRPRLAAGVAVVALALGFGLGILAVVKGRTLRERLTQGVSVLRSPRRYLRRVVLWQAVDWTLRAVTIACFLSAFGLHPTVERAAIVQATQSVSSLFPLTPAGIGTEQAFLLYALSGEASHAEVLSFSVGMRLVLAAVNAAAAAVALLLTIRTLRWRRVDARERQAAPPPESLSDR